MKALLFLFIVLGLSAYSQKSHPPHSHSCSSHDIYHGFTDKEYQQIQEDMDEIRFMLDDLEQRMR